MKSAKTERYVPTPHFVFVKGFCEKRYVFTVFFVEKRISEYRLPPGVIAR